MAQLDEIVGIGRSAAAGNAWAAQERDGAQRSGARIGHGSACAAIIYQHEPMARSSSGHHGASPGGHRSGRELLSNGDDAKRVSPRIGRDPQRRIRQGGHDFVVADHLAG